jgi:uncharacterized membrane protein
MPGWRRIVLPLSIVLNLFLMAVIGGTLWHNRRPLPPGSPLARALANAEAILPPEDAAKFGAVLRRDAPSFMDAAQKLRDARQELNRELGADPFDKDGARLALAAWQVAWDQFLSDFRGPLMDALAQVSADGRRKLIAARNASRADP